MEQRVVDEQHLRVRQPGSETDDENHQRVQDIDEHGGVGGKGQARPSWAQQQGEKEEHRRQEKEGHAVVARPGEGAQQKHLTGHERSA